MIATGANPWLLRQSHRTPGGVTEAVDVGLGGKVVTSGRAGADGASLSPASVTPAGVGEVGGTPNVEQGMSNF